MLYYYYYKVQTQSATPIQRQFTKSMYQHLITHLQEHQQIIPLGQTHL